VRKARRIKYKLWPCEHDLSPDSVPPHFIQNISRDEGEGDLLLTLYCTFFEERVKVE
jgi:hypothetical protein